MATTTADTKKRHSVTFSPTEMLSNVYGPYAFGLISVVVLWFLAVSPQLEANRIDFEAQQEIIIKLNQISANQMQLALAMSNTADTLERTVEKLRYENGKQ